MTVQIQIPKKNLKLRGSKPILCTKNANSDTKLCMCLPISPINQFLVLNPIWYLPVKKHHVLVKMTLLGSILTKNGHKIAQKLKILKNKRIHCFSERKAAHFEVLHDNVCHN